MSKLQPLTFVSWNSLMPCAATTGFWASLATAPSTIPIDVGSSSVVKCWQSSLPRICETQCRAVSTRFGAMSEPLQKL